MIHGVKNKLIHEPEKITALHTYDDRSGAVAKQDNRPYSFKFSISTVLWNSDFFGVCLSERFQTPFPILLDLPVPVFHLIIEYRSLSFVLSTGRIILSAHFNSGYCSLHPALQTLLLMAGLMITKSLSSSVLSA